MIQAAPTIDGIAALVVLAGVLVFALARPRGLPEAVVAVPCERMLGRHRGWCSPC